MKAENENEMIKKPDIPTPIKKSSQALLKEDSKKTLPPKKPSTDSLKIEASLDRAKNSATKSPGPFFNDNRGYSSVSSSVAKSSNNRNSSTACQSKRSPGSEQFLTPSRSSENIKYSPIKNVNNVITENLNLINQIRSSHDSFSSAGPGGRSPFSVGNQIKIIHNNLETKDYLNKTPEGDIVNLSFFNGRDSRGFSSSNPGSNY